MNHYAYKWEIKEQIFSEDQMYSQLESFSKQFGLKETLQALPYALEKHADQYRRKLKCTHEKIPYIVHPLMMACHALAMGLHDDKLLTVILLHDVCEDCGVAPQDLPFSEDVKIAVNLLTKRYDKSFSKAENSRRYYDAMRSNKYAVITKVLDRCNNVSTMAQSFDDKAMSGYIDDTEKHVFPLLDVLEQNWPECGDVAFLLKYQIISTVESLKIMIEEKDKKRGPSQPPFSQYSL